MTTPFTYEFGYSWSITWGLLIPMVVFGAVAAAGLRLRWRRWMVIASALVVAWGIVGLLITHALFRINLPMSPPTDRFASSGSGRFVDIGAGSGRATIGLLLARPASTSPPSTSTRGTTASTTTNPERLTETRTSQVSPTECRLSSATRERCRSRLQPTTASSVWRLSTIFPALEFPKRSRKLNASSSPEANFCWPS